jgi:hypothetical protein
VKIAMALGSTLFRLLFVEALVRVAAPLRPAPDNGNAIER